MIRAGTALVLVSALLLAALPALAQDSPRYAPAEGTVIHIENRLTRTRDGVAESNSRLVLDQHVTSSRDGMRWEASDSFTHDEGRGLDQLSNTTIRDYLRAISAGRHFVYHAFLQIESTAIQFTPIAKPDGSFVGVEAGWMLRTTLDCPWTEFQRFFPIGQVAGVSMRCVRRVWTAKKEEPAEFWMQILVADDGSAFAHTATDDLPARRIRVTEVEDSGTVRERIMLFSERWGVPLQSDMAWRVSRMSGGPAIAFIDHSEMTPSK